MDFRLYHCVIGALLATFCARLVLPAPTSSSGSQLPPHRLSKRSYLDIECRGVFNKSVYARLNSICRDCFELYQDPELHNLCRQDCFGTRYFVGCVQALTLQDQADQLATWIRMLRGSRFS